MINKFPKIIEKDKLIKWLITQKDLAKSDGYKYKACGNLDEYERHMAQASAYENIIIHMNYHMEE